MSSVLLQHSMQCPRGQSELPIITRARINLGWREKKNLLMKKKENNWLKMRNTHLMQQLLQFLLQLHKIPGGHQAILGLVQTVSGELHQLVLNESKHTISQGQSSVRGTLCDDVEQPTLHLRCRLGNETEYFIWKSDTRTLFIFNPFSERLKRFTLILRLSDRAWATLGKRSL